MAPDTRKLKDRAAELAARGKLDKAADVYRQALAGDPRDTATHQKLADVLRRAGRLGEAVEAYRAVADRYAHDGLLIKAIAISKTILELDPDHVATQASLADLYSKRAAVEKVRPPARTVVMAAVRATSASPGGPPVLEPADRLVAIPITTGGPSVPSASGGETPRAFVPGGAEELRPPVPSLAPAQPPPGGPSLVRPPLAPGQPPLAGPSLELPEEEAVPIELVVERPGEAPRAEEPPAASPAAPPPEPPRSAPARRADTGFQRIVSAAHAAVAAGVEDALVTAERVEESFEIDVEGDEPLGPPAPPRATPPPLPPVLPQVPLFSDLSHAAFVALATETVLHRVAAGEAVIREGDATTSFYVIASGRLAVSKRDERGAPVVLARLGEGDFFGEMALLSGAPRAATVAAEAPCELLEFRAETLLALAGRHPHVAASLRRFYRQRLLANAMAVSPIFRPFARGDRKHIMERFRARDVTDGETVIREGEPSDGLYVLLDGRVDVVKRRDGADVLVSQLHEGDLFGEMSCLRKAPASASVVVRRAGTLLRLPRAQFDELVVTYPQILELVAELSEERAENLDAILSGRAEWTEDGLVLI